MNTNKHRLISKRSAKCVARNVHRRFCNVTNNPRSELANATIGTNQYGFIFDNIGNRESYTNNAETFTYLANGLNQYTNITDGVTNTPTYDLDGNMLTHNGWTYSWNGENRMVQASNLAHVISYSYDFTGRMFEKVVDGETNNLAWDGFNIVAEFSPSRTNYNVFGLDLSGSLQGAGGIGGLIATIQDGEAYFTAFDANGNITEYVGTNGTVVAQREYSPFGQTIALTGTKKDDFTHWWSTKSWDAATGMSEYELRKYLVELGRWGSKDPIEETGGINLYGFVHNKPTSLVDRLGNDFDDLPEPEVPRGPYWPFTESDDFRNLSRSRWKDLVSIDVEWMTFNWGWGWLGGNPIRIPERKQHGRNSPARVGKCDFLLAFLRATPTSLYPKSEWTRDSERRGGGYNPLYYPAATSADTRRSNRNDYNVAPHVAHQVRWSDSAWESWNSTVLWRTDYARSTPQGYSLLENWTMKGFKINGSIVQLPNLSEPEVYVHLVNGRDIASGSVSWIKLWVEMVKQAPLNRVNDSMWTWTSPRPKPVFSKTLQLRPK